MGKQIQRTQTLETFVDSTKDKLAAVWHKLDDAEGQALVQAVYERVIVLANEVDEKERLLVSVRAALVEAVNQRDMAITEVKMMQQQEGGRAKRRLASEIAIANDITEQFPDVLRVLSVLVGDRATFEEELLTNLVEAFTELGHALYVEQVYEAAVEADND